VIGRYDLVRGEFEAMDDILHLLAFIRLLLSRAAGLMHPTPQEETFLENLLGQRTNEDGNPFATAVRLGQQLSPSLTSFVLFMQLYKWDEHGSDQAMLFDERGPPAMRPANGPDARLAIELWSAVRALAWADPDQHDATGNSELALVLAGLAAELEAHSAADLAYDLLSCAVGLMGEDDPALADTATAGLRLALAAEKPPQIAVMSAKRAVAAIAVATTDLTSRLDAYGMVETAIERIGLADEELQADLAEIIYPSLKRHEWLTHLRLRLMPYVVTEEARDQYRALMGVPDWPPRVARLPLSEAQRFMPGIFHLLRAEIDFENERLSLARLVTQTQVNTNDIDWTFQLASYARAVPHSSSLLRERRLPERLSLLTHEVTHVLSFLGHIGSALIALRVAGIMANAALMASGRSDGDDVIKLFISRNGIPPLQPGDLVVRI
jgi:hypothetical protein